MINAIKKFLGMEHEIDSRLFKIFYRSMYLYDVDANPYIEDVTEFYVTKISDRTILHISTRRPGFLIGKGGANINAIKKFLQEVTEFDNLEIALKESKDVFQV